MPVHEARFEEGEEVTLGNQFNHDSWAIRAGDKLTVVTCNAAEYACGKFCCASVDDRRGKRHFIPVAWLQPILKPYKLDIEGIAVTVMVKDKAACRKVHDEMYAALRAVVAKYDGEVTTEYEGVYSVG